MSYQVKALFAFLLPSVLSVAAVAQTPEGGKETAIEVDGTEIKRQLREREDKISKLPPDERERLQTAYDLASNDPEVKAAAAKRNQAVEDFRLVLRRSMLKANPAIAPLLDKMQRP